MWGATPQHCSFNGCINNCTPVGKNTTNDTLTNETILTTEKGRNTFQNTKIGVDTVSPYYKFDVRFNNADTALSGGSDGDWAGDGLRLQNNNTTAGSMSLIHFRSGNNADWHIGTKFVTSADSDIVFLQEGVNEKLRIKNNGKIGIGTAGPNTLLHIHGTASSQKLITLSCSTLRNNYIGVNGSDNLEIGADEDNEGSDSSMRLRVDGTERVRITGTKMGIGTNDPATSLTIKGDEGLYIQSSTNAVEAKIRLSSHVASVDYGNPFSDGAFQYGTISYNHSDVTSGSYYNATTYNERFLVQGTETRTKFQVNGDIWSVSEDGATGKVAMIDGYVRSQRSISAGLMYHPDGTRTYNGSESSIAAYVNDSNSSTYLAARENNDWSAVFFSRYDGGNRHSMHGNGHASNYRNLYVGRCFENGTSATPTSIYYSGEQSVSIYASASNDRTFVAARNVADTQDVFLSEVDGEDNIQFTAAGNGYWDGNGDAGAADYAEYFEWEDGNPNNEDRVGRSVVIVPDTNGKIGIASTTDDPSLIIGVVSGRPGFVGDSAHFAWHGRYKSDEFDRRIMEPIEIYTHEGVDGEVERIRKDRLEEGFEIPDNWTLTTTDSLSLSNDYDSNIPYTPRENRQEWSPIGLMGKLTIYKNQIKGDRWIKLKDINEQLERWLVR